MKNMKSKVTSTIIWLMIGAGTLSEWKLGYEWAGNLSLFASWVLITITFIALAMPPKDVFKKDNRSNLTRIAFLTTIVIMVSAGWFSTALFALCAWCCMWLKREMYLDKTNPKAAR